MYKKITPCLAVGSLAEINPCSLIQQGIRGIIFDLDNTIVPWGNPLLAKEVIDWFAKLQKKGFKICIVSNSRSKRVRKIAVQAAVPYIAGAIKPLKSGFRQAAKLMQLPDSQIAVVGDQLFTDMLGGNRLGMFTILVPPLSKREFFTTVFMRKLESLVMKRLKKRGLM